jgi:hypothetical protein
MLSQRGDGCRNLTGIAGYMFQQCVTAPGELREELRPFWAGYPCHRGRPLIALDLKTTLEADA